MIFGLAKVAASIAYATTRQDMLILIAGLLVGGSWFAFGKYGGLPLVNTVADWHPSTSGAIDDMHRQGLLVKCRRRWIVWAAIPGTFAVAALLIPPLVQAGHPELVILLVLHHG